jgi:carbon monoxide dehydrogenase subunit G
MALKFENEFVVDAPIERTWHTLLDLPRVARCLPGATIEPVSEDGSYQGSMRVKVGPVTMDYKGVATLTELDEAARLATFNVQGKELRGQGTASATIRNSLVAEGDSTRVLVEPELSDTGRPAQFGRGIMQDVAGSMLVDFAKSLSEMMASEPAVEDSAAPAQAPAVEPEPAKKEALDLTGHVGGVLRQRLAKWTGLAALKRLFSRKS